MSKKHFMISICVLGGFATASAQDGAVNEADLLNIGLLPNTIPVLDSSNSDPGLRPIAAAENNPFSERETDAPQVVLQTESEELKIKKLIDDMTVHGGLMKRAGGPKILLGDLILKKGALVPQILPDQTEQLVVRELDQEKIELAFLDTPEYKGQPRVIVIPLDIRPTVGQVLAGGNDEYVVHRGRDEMAAEEQLAAVLASRASGGSIGTTIPGIKVNGKTAKREASSGLSSLLRNYGQPGASGITSSPAPVPNGGVGGGVGNGRPAGTSAPGSGASGGSASPADFGGFLTPAQTSPQGASSVAPGQQQEGAARPRTDAPSSTPPPSFTN